MTEHEYKMLQKRLTNKLCHNPYRTSGDDGLTLHNYAECYRDGIMAAKSILHSFYQDYPPSTFEETK